MKVKVITCERYTGTQVKLLHY